MLFFPKELRFSDGFDHSPWLNVYPSSGEKREKFVTSSSKEEVGAIQLLKENVPNITHAKKYSKFQAFPKQQNDTLLPRSPLQERNTNPSLASPSLPAKNSLRVEVHKKNSQDTNSKLNADSEEGRGTESRKNNVDVRFEGMSTGRNADVSGRDNDVNVRLERMIGRPLAGLHSPSATDKEKFVLKPHPKGNVASSSSASSSSLVIPTNELEAVVSTVTASNQSLQALCRFASCISRFNIRPTFLNVLFFLV